mgnify:CR=1 FL=1
MSYTASAINLRVDAPRRKDGAEELESADVHALMSESMGNIGKPDAKARGRKGRLDLAILLDLAPMRATLDAWHAWISRKATRVTLTLSMLCLWLTKQV